jgi:hypothetical protein
MDGELEWNGSGGKEKLQATLFLFPFLEAVVDVADAVDDLKS